MLLISSHHPSFPSFSTLLTLHLPLFTQAALMGGTTMVLALVLPEQHCSLLDAYEKCRALADAKVCCDYALHVGVTWWGPKVRTKGLNLSLIYSFFILRPLLCLYLINMKASVVYKYNV